MSKVNCRLSCVDNILRIREIFRDNRKEIFEDVEEKSNDLYGCMYKLIDTEAYRTSCDLYFLKNLKRIWQRGINIKVENGENKIFFRQFARCFSDYCKLCKSSLARKEVLDDAIKCLEMILEENDNTEKKFASLSVEFEKIEFLLDKELKKCKEEM